MEINRYQKYIVAECVGQVVGCAWLENINDENADCEVIALYVRYKSRGNGIGKALLQYAMEQFKNNGNINMIIWCLKDNAEARKFYEKIEQIKFPENKKKQQSKQSRNCSREDSK